jgi:hypothetical protein
MAYKKFTAKQGKKFCDELWTKIVKARDNNQCAICGKTEYLNAHHLISRKVFKFRWKIDNGISLCPSHHEFSVELSPHNAPWNFEIWLKENRPEQYSQHCLDRKDISSIKTNYDEIYYYLEQQYFKITGNYQREKRVKNYEEK